jgi:hypothetical protein
MKGREGWPAKEGQQRKEAREGTGNQGRKGVKVGRKEGYQGRKGKEAEVR